MPTLTQDLILLETRGLVRVTLENEKPIVRFKHALTREATYNSILQARRIELHRSVAQTLNQIYPQPDLELVLTIAEHWQRGGNGAQALETILPHAQSLVYTGRGLSLTTLLSGLNREQLDPTQQRDLDLTLADASAARGEYHDARELYERALTNADEPSLRIRILQGLGVCNYHLGSFARAIEYYQASLKAAEETGDLVQQARATGGMGAAYVNSGEYERARKYLERSRAFSIQAGREVELANAEGNMALALYYQGEYAQAIQAAQRALEIDERLGHSTLAARTYPLLGYCYYSLGDLERAEDYYRRAYESSRALGDTWGEANELTSLAELYGERGELERAAATYQQAIPLLQTLKHEVALAFSLTGLGEIQLKQAQQPKNSAQAASLIENALTNVQQALTLAQHSSLREREGAALRVLAEIQAAQGNFEMARTTAERAVHALEQAGQSIERRRAYRTYGQLLAQSSDPIQQASSAQFLARAEKGA
ncbi:MAG TPA: tetratricopeptide repeat protein [Anaerolineae bacterium]|nr:tetratricopeptide repeat protein [Anaerolineae bacterium]